MRYEELKEQIIKSPCTRYKLSAAITSFNDMDPVDALHDAEALLMLMRFRCEDMGLINKDTGLNECGEHYIKGAR